MAKHNLPTDTEGVHWIGWDAPTLYPDWVRQSEFPNILVKGRFNNATAQLAAVKAGIGIARLPYFLCDLEPSLQRIAPGSSAPCHDIWILTHKDLVATVRIQTFMDFMADAFRQKRDLLEGRCYKSNQTTSVEEQ